uniref:Zinc finger protein 276 n=1 Tax=Periophthalmus magnuspinnatus TaxID=409849 RepID=A0A3B4AZZ3_9GOBI
TTRRGKRTEKILHVIMMSLCPSGRMPSALCRLCHGKFSSRSLRNAFSSSSRDHVDCEEERSVVFHSDFQRLVGVKLNQDPRLSKFICKTCHSKFYKCHGILLRFLQRVNLPPMGEEKLPWCFTSDHQCLHSLVSWAHHHAGACSSCPALMDVLESQCRGSVRALWGCGDGHSYEMDTYFSCPEPEQEGDGDTTEESPLNQEDHVESSEPNNCSNKEGLYCSVFECIVTLCFIREELPSMFKCPYLGCTAVYRGPDGLKKHIREHHEEVKERPCPHPGCNKVFMIDRYLQRHIKLIHTEERNYICDECGQTFKQRKHLSVHQMRHSGAKPLQCEVCGFQCRQRASLKYHMTKHKAEAELEFACVICEKRFEKAHNLNVHMSMVHPLTQPEVFTSPPKPPSCSGRGRNSSVNVHSW